MDGENTEFDLNAAMDTTLEETAKSLAGEVESAPAVGESSVPPATTEPATTTPAVPEAPSDFPKSWRKELAPKWATLDADARAEIIKREQDMERGARLVKEPAERWSKFEQTLAPYMENIKTAAGGDVNAAVSALLQADHVLRHGTPEQKVQYLDMLRQQYGVGTAEQVQSQDPQVRELQARLNKMEAGWTDAQRRTAAEMQGKIATEVNTFASDPAHPYFDELQDDIAKNINAGYNLKDSYDRAVWGNPVTREKELIRIKQDSEKAVKEKSRLESLAAKKAQGTKVQSSDSARSPQEPLGSWEDTMKEQLAEINSRPN